MASSLISLIDGILKGASNTLGPRTPTAANPGTGGQPTPPAAKHNTASILQQILGGGVAGTPQGNVQAPAAPAQPVAPQGPLNPVGILGQILTGQGNVRKPVTPQAPAATPSGPVKPVNLTNQLLGFEDDPLGGEDQ